MPCIRAKYISSVAARRSSNESEPRRVCVGRCPCAQRTTHPAAQSPWECLARCHDWSTMEITLALFTAACTFFNIANLFGALSSGTRGSFSTYYKNVLCCCRPLYYMVFMVSARAIRGKRCWLLPVWQIFGVRRRRFAAIVPLLACMITLCTGGMLELLRMECGSITCRGCNPSGSPCVTSFARGANTWWKNALCASVLCGNFLKLARASVDCGSGPVFLSTVFSHIQIC
jgi:hypothetical protein